MKTCTSCKTEQLPTAFRPRRNQCRGCERAFAKTYRLANLEREKARAREWGRKNPEKRRESVKRWRDAHPEESRKRSLQQYYARPHLQRARAAKRRAAELQAAPKWLTEDHRKQMQQFYLLAKQKEAETGIPHHVDHIHPLQGRNACGLHVPWNLQVLPATENIRKGNKWPGV